MAQGTDETRPASGQTRPTGEPTPASVLGEMVWLYSASELHRGWPIASIHQWLMPAIAHRQYRIYRRGKRPVGLVTWARMTAETETAYVRNTRSLKPEHWVGGDRNWVIDFIAPFGDARRIANDLRRNVFPNEVGRFLRVRKGDDTLRIFYIHGVKAIDKARDWERNPNVVLDPAGPGRLQ
jgi:cytolysin-activating lysine-acyltransferase